MIYLRYLKSLLRHKWFVFVEARKLGIPWLGVIHDLSKFRPDEFIPYARHFFGDHPEEPPEYVAQELVDGHRVYRTKLTVKDEFDLAWLKHQRRNKHHWQWWVLMNDTDGTYPLEMPKRYRLEMLADWRGAGRAYGGGDTVKWYGETIGRGRLLHELTEQAIRLEMGLPY